MNKIVKFILSLLIAFVSLGIVSNETLVEAATPTDSFQYIGKVKTIEKNGRNKVDIVSDNNEKIRITFLDENIFRLNMELSTGQFVDKPEPNSPKHTTEMLVKHEEDYVGADVAVTQNNEYYIVSTTKVELKISKDDSKMTLVNKETNRIVWEEKEPLQYKKNKTLQTLKSDPSEYFYGGGMQNGYFSHKGTSINIVKNPNKWIDGYAASPTPFYISTKGYGAMRYTWQEGTYDFGEEDLSTIKTEHNETRFDAFYFVESDDVILSVMQDYLELTGAPYLMPEYGWYLAHLNCYSRDTWKKTNTGAPLYDINGENWKEDKTGNVTEKLNGTDGPTAENIINMYTENDMPFGMILPNDGYGCGYGRTGSLNDNIKNLGTFSSYANSKGIETGLWTQSAITPEESSGAIPDLQRDLANETKVGGVRALKTDVAWVGAGYSMALHAIATSHRLIEENSDYRAHVISLDGWNGTQRYAAVWSGDQTGGNWEYIRFHIPTYIGAGLSGLPNVASDQNGIWGQDPIINTRDYQWKAFTPIQLDMDGWAGEVKMPSYYKQYAEINRFYLKLKAEMLPYNYSNGWEATSTGMPMVRAMVLEYPNDPYTYGPATQYQYMWGKNLLVAPVYQNVAADAQGNDVRNGIYLPDEDQVWIDYFSGKQYTGGSIINNYEVPIWKQPIFVKNGAIIPMTEENNSPTQIASDATRIFDVYPSGKSDFTMYEDDGTSREYRNGAYATTHITANAPVKGDGVATITVEKPVGDYASTKKSATRSTQFNVNVQKEPTSIQLSVGGSNVTLAKVTSMDDFNNATTAVYFYDASPDLNKYAHLGGSYAKLDKILTSPKLFVKTAKDVNITKNEIKLVVNGFNNTETPEDDGSTQIPSIPQNVRIDDALTSDAQIAFEWDASNQASGYDIIIDEKLPVYVDIKDTKYILKGLEQDSEHTIQVRASNSRGKSDWSTKLVAKTKVDRYRNVPKGMTIRFDGVAEPAIYTGVLSNIVDGTDSSEYSSRDSGAWIDKAFEIDMKKAYNLEKIEYDYRSDGSNGAVKHFELNYSMDGLFWEKVDWKIDVKNEPLIIPDEGNEYRQATLVFNSPIVAKYLNFKVKDSSGGFLQSYEIRPYSVDGKGFIPGDYNENGELDNGDLEFLKNYTGRTVGDADWGYVSKADLNKNGVIDAFDLVYVSSKLGKTLVPTNETSSGAISLIPNKSNAQTGEEIVYSVYGNDFNDVNAFYLQTILDNKYSFVTDSIQPTGVDLHMINYSKLVEGSSRINIIFANQGENQRIHGSNVLATFKLKANTDIADTTLAIDKAFIVGTNMIEKNANTSENVENTQPDFSDVKLKLSDIKTITFDNDVKKNMDGSTIWQQSNWRNILFDGNTSGSLAEFKWYMSGSQANFPEEVKVPMDMNFEFKELQGLKTIKVYNRESSNGRITSIKAAGYHGNNVVDLGTINIVQNVYTFNVPNDVKLDKVVLTPLTTTGSTGEVPSGLKTNRMLSIYEIEFYANNNTVLESMKFEEAEAEVSIGRMKGMNVLFTPDNATYKAIDMSSSNPEIAKIEKTIDANGKASYYAVGLKAGTATIQATSKENAQITATMKLTIKDTKDVKELKALIDEVKKYASDVYSESSFKTLKTRIDEAEVILNEPSSTQEAIDTALINLLKAKLNLEYREVRENEKIPVTIDDITLLNATAQYHADNNVAQRAIDNDKSTFWESPYSGANAGLPKDIVLELVDVANVDQLNFIPMNRLNGAVTEFKVYTSLDGITWVDGAHVNLDAKRYTIDKDYSPEVVIFAARDAKYIKFEVLSALESSGQPGANYADVAELEVYGRFNANKITTTTSKNELIIDETTTLSTIVEPVYTTYKEVTYTSSDPTIASADNNGVVSAHQKGKVIITVELVHNPSVKTTLEISVNPTRDLVAAISKANAYTDESLYTPTSWNDFTIALEEAKIVLAQFDAQTRALITQNMMNEATQKLNTAIDNLVVLTTKDKLDEVIAKAEKLIADSIQTDYTQGSWKHLEDTIVNAKKAVSDEDMANAQKDLEDAMNTLVSIKGLKDELATLNQISGDYSQASIDAYNKVIADAKALLLNPGATKEEVNATIETLKTIDTKLIDVSLLSKKIKDVQTTLDTNRAKYTDQYVETLEKAIAQAKIDKDALLSVEGLNNLMNTLTNISDKPIYKGNNKALKEFIESVEVKAIIDNKSNYTSTTYAQFQSAFDHAVSIMKNTNATQKEIDDAMNNLSNYIDKLERIKEPSKPVPPINGNDKTDSNNGKISSGDVGTFDSTSIQTLLLGLLLSSLVLIQIYRKRS